MTRARKQAPPASPRPSAGTRAGSPGSPRSTWPASWTRCGSRGAACVILGRPIPYLDTVALEFPEMVIVGGHIGYAWTAEMISLATAPARSSKPESRDDRSRALSHHAWPPSCATFRTTGQRSCRLHSAGVPRGSGHGRPWDRAKLEAVNSASRCVALMLTPSVGAALT
jgi:hypothetical protein